MSQPPAKRRRLTFEKCLAKEIVELLQPDYSEKIAEIEAHETKFVVLLLGSATSGETGPTKWYRVLFTASDCVVVQEIELTAGYTRFKIKKIQFSDWDEKFVEWIGTDHDRFCDAASCWNDGMQMYGANV